MASDTKGEFSAEEMWINFITKSPYVDGSRQPWSLPQDIPWFDKDRFNRGLIFVKEYIALHSFVLLWYNIMMTAFSKPLASVFFRDHQLYPENIWLERNLKGMKFVLGWLEHDMTDLRSQGTKELRIVRAAHEKYARMEAKHDLLIPLPDNLIPKGCHQKAQEIRELCQDIPVSNVPAEILSWHPSVPFSQFVMAIGLFVGWGPFSTMPVIKNNLTDKSSGLSDYVHLLAVGARMLGVEDKYNLALYSDPFLAKKVMGLFNIFLKEVDATSYSFLEPSWKTTSKLGITMNVILYFIVQQSVEYPEKIRTNMNWREKITVGLINKWIKVYLKYRPIRILSNLLAVVIGKLIFLVYLNKGHKNSKHIRKVNGMCSYYRTTEK